MIADNTGHSLILTGNREVCPMPRYVIKLWGWGEGGREDNYVEK